MLNTVMENKNKIFTNISIFNLKSWLQIMINYGHDLRRKIEILLQLLLLFSIVGN